MKPLIFLVEDDADISRLVRHHLEAAGYAVHAFPAAGAVLGEAEKEHPSLFLLDIMVPGGDGLDLCRRIRQMPMLGMTPVIFLTAKTAESDRVLGLDLGADDYITKPFSPRELVARIKAHLRRSDGDAAPQTALSMGPFRLDRGARRIFQGGREEGEREIELTSTEFKLLEFFLTHPGTAWSREQLLHEVWGEQHFVTPRTVDVHIRRLREQIEEKPDEPAWLVTVRGFGYRFETR